MPYSTPEHESAPAQVELFAFQSQSVRVIMTDGEPWWVASDVAKVLGYRDAANAIRILREKERGTHLVSTPSGQQRLTVISEQGLYRLVMRSDRAEAEAFQDWVTGEVLPQIRRTGQYAPSAPAIPQSFAEALELAAAQAREIEAQTAALEAAAPKVEAFEAFLDRDGMLTITEAAKSIGAPPNKLFAKLRQHRVLNSGRGQLNQPRADLCPRYFTRRPNGYVDPGGREHTTTMVTAEGMSYLAKFAERHGLA